MNPRRLAFVSTFSFFVGCSSAGNPEPVTEPVTETDTETGTETESVGATLRPASDPAVRPEVATSCRERCAPYLDDPYFGDHNYAVCLCRCTRPTRPPWSCGEYM